ncbi:MAG: hypothetical protein HFE97_05785 [Oscillospiraceae bacterium]|nr:hypothetical protein [Oscillospiraceae bacterium]
MKRLTLALLVILLFILAGCGAEQSTVSEGEIEYSSDKSVEDCYLCGGGIENLIPSYWGQNNVALISLNSFEIKPVEINRYNRLDGRLIEEYAGVVSFGNGGGIAGGFSVSLMLNYDRGYATGFVDFHNDETLNIERTSSFLCTNCLNKILPQKISQCFGVGVINFETKEIPLFEKNLAGFGLGDFYIDCNLKERRTNDSHQMDLLIFYCPIRYGGTP